VVDVDSYEPERSFARFAVCTTIDALHEAHVGRNERISRLLTVRNPRLRDHAVDMRHADDTVEIGDGRGLRVDRIEKPGRTWAVNVDTPPSVGEPPGIGSGSSGAAASTRRGVRIPLPSATPAAIDPPVMRTNSRRDRDEGGRSKYVV
jgi:hypothetical protein